MSQSPARPPSLEKQPPTEPQVPAGAPATLADVPATLPENFTQAQYERHWLAHVYQGDRTPQFTLRAVLAGCLIGSVMSFSNLYVGLKSGWGLGASITSAILAFGFFTAWESITKQPKEKHFTVLENNTMQTAASSAAYMTSAGLVAAIPALYMTTGQAMTFTQTMIWLIAVCSVGIVAAIPLKRRLINQERLNFPSGVACAETLQSLHATGKEGVAKAKALGISGLVAAVFTLVKEGFALIPGTLPIFGKSMVTNTVALGTEMWTIGAGALMGLRVTTSMLLGGFFTFAILPGWLLAQGYVQCKGLADGATCTPEQLGYPVIQAWTLWPGVALMVSQSLMGLVLMLPKLLKGFLGAKKVQQSGAEDQLSAQERAYLESIEIPMRWFWIGLVIAGVLAVTVQRAFFDIGIPYGILSVALAIALAFVAARAVGETDINPVGAMGKVTQLVFGGVLRGQIAPNLMAASVTGGAASQAGDLCTDLKTGHLLGTNPRFQFFAQLMGILVGAVFATWAYTILVDPVTLGTAEWPAPAALAWAGVAQLLSNGLGSVEPHLLTAIWVGAAIGAGFALVERFLPGKVRQWMPSPTGFGIAMMVPFYYSFNMWLGAVIAWFITRSKPAFSKAYLIVIASGLVAGDSLMGVAVKAVKMLGG